MAGRLQIRMTHISDMAPDDFPLPIRSMVQPIPAGYAGVTSYLIIRDAASAIDYYKKAFGATEVMRFPGPDGKVGHAELKIAGGNIMAARTITLPSERKLPGIQTVLV